MVNQIINELLHNPSNTKCADCPSTTPTHVSCLFGVLICSRCSDFHQSICFGKNKVLQLDSKNFTETDLKILKSTGNQTSNEKLERNVPTCYKRPTYDDPLVLMEQWIKGKYERKEFDEFSSSPAYMENVFQGYLWKRGKKKNVFKIRKFVLNKNLKLLTYFIKEGQNAQAKAKLSVDALEVLIQPEKIGHPYGMQVMVHTSDVTRSLYLYAETAEDLVNWYTAIYGCKLQWLQIAFPSTSVTEFYKVLWPSVLKEGWLMKCGPKKNDSFYRRWVVIVKRKLFYYNEPMDPFPRGEVFIGSKEHGGYSVKLSFEDILASSEDCGDRLSASSSGGSTSNSGLTAATHRKGWVFYVDTPKRTFTFQAESEWQRKEWTDVVHSLIDQPLSSCDQKTLNRTGVKKVVSKRLSSMFPFNK